MQRKRPTPHRVDVPFDKRPPRGVLWAQSAVCYHAARPHYNRSLGMDIPAAPAALDELRASIRAELSGCHTGHNWLYYRGRNLACPYRCALDSNCCPVDVLIEEVNKPSSLLDRMAKLRLKNVN